MSSPATQPAQATQAQSNDTIQFTHERKEDGRLAITTHLPDGGKFIEVLDVQEPEQRLDYLNKLCGQYPGIDRKAAREELIKIARATRIDLRWDISGRVNGTAKASARLFNGKQVIDTASLNLLDAGQRTKSIKHLAPYIAGRNASKKKIEAAMRELNRLFRDKLQEILTAPPVTAGGHGFDPGRPEAISYEMIDGVGIVWVKPVAGGGAIRQRLTNFIARILANVWRTDGVEKTCELELEATIASRPGGARRFSVKHSDFMEMGWPVRELGAEAVIEPENGYEKRARTAIQKLSTDIVQKTLYTHTGWMKTEEAGHVYLHAGGIISSAATPPSIQVAMDSGVAHYVLPAAPADEHGLRAAVRASLAMLSLAPPHVVYPVYCLIWRSVLRRSKFMVHVVGRTGTFKSELTALAQQHFGAGMDASNLPGAWRSTGNALGEQAFLAKDTLFTVDDFKLKGGPKDRQAMHDKADEFIRGNANGTGKQRMRAEGGLRGVKAPRSTILSSGEHVPDGESCRARQLVVELSPDDIDGKRLTPRQRDAREGLYAAAMAGYIRWLCEEGRIEKVRSNLATLIPMLREKAECAGVHRRTPEIVANLYAGFGFFLEFAREKGVIGEEDEKIYRDAAWAALTHVAAQQKDHQVASEPVTRYLELLMSALGSGKAHLAGVDGNAPGEEIAAACGWWQRFNSSTWEARGLRIGWISERGIFLNPDAAYEAAQNAAGSGGGFVEPEADLRKRLDERGLLLFKKRDEFNRRTVRETLERSQRWVLWLRPGALSISCARCARCAEQEDDNTLVFAQRSGVQS